jgi:hypothetical protein
VAYYFDVVLWSAPFHHTFAHWIQALAEFSFKQILVATLLAVAALVPLLWMWPMGGNRSAARARRSAAFAVAVVGFTELGLEILLLLGFQALYGYVYHELTILVALFMVGVALGGWWELRSAAKLSSGLSMVGVGSRSILRGASPQRNLRLLAGVQIVLAASPLLLYELLVRLEAVSSARGQRAASEILFPALALVAGWVGGFQFLLASRIYFAEPQPRMTSGEAAGSASLDVDLRAASSPLPPTKSMNCAEDTQTGRSPGVLYALDLAGACVGALALSLLLVPVYGFLHTAALMAVVNLVPAVMALAASRRVN